MGWSPDVRNFWKLPDDRLLVEQLRLLYGNVGVSVIPAVLLALLLVYTLRNDANSHALMLWCAGVIVSKLYAAIDARKHLANMAALMPADCWAVLFDICGLDRGLQDVEAERDWPRRGGKLVLRIALSHLAMHYGRDAEGRGREATRQRHWLPERAPMFPPSEAS